MAGSAYIREKAAVAIHCLAVSDADLPTRLADAWISGLNRLRRDDMSDLDDDAVEAYHRVRDRLGETAAEGRRLGALVAAQRLSDEDALATARDIAEFHAAVMPG
jgi:hypothetical protein